MLPIATTTITVKRHSGDAYDPDNQQTTIVRTVPAVLSSPSGDGQPIAGNSERMDMLLTCGTCDLRANDEVIDNATGQSYRARYVQRRYEVGMDHMSAGLRRSEV